MDDEIVNNDLNSNYYKKGYKKGYSDAIYGVFIILQNNQKEQERSLIDLLNNTISKMNKD